MVATTADILRQQAAGKYVMRSVVQSTTTNHTTATATCGFMNFQFTGNALGTTFPNTIQSINGPASVASEWMFLNMTSGSTIARHGGVGRIYRLGTCTFTALGEAFTPDAITLPLIRTEMGAASRPQSFIPIIQVTGTTGGTPVQFQIRNAGSTAGYVNQAGTTVVGNKTFIFPTATTAINSTYFLPLNNGDSSCRSITNIACTVAGTNAFATIWLLEDLGIGQGLVAGAGLTEHLYGSGLRATQCAPAVATSGSATTSLVGYNITNSFSAIGSTLLSLSVVP